MYDVSLSGIGPFLRFFYLVAAVAAVWPAAVSKTVRNDAIMTLGNEARSAEQEGGGGGGGKGHMQLYL